MLDQSRGSSDPMIGTARQGAKEGGDILCNYTEPSGGPRLVDRAKRLAGKSSVRLRILAGPAVASTAAATQHPTHSTLQCRVERRPRLIKDRSCSDYRGNTKVYLTLKCNGFPQLSVL